MQIEECTRYQESTCRTTAGSSETDSASKRGTERDSERDGEGKGRRRTWARSRSSRRSKSRSRKDLADARRHLPAAASLKWRGERQAVVLLTCDSSSCCPFPSVRESAVPHVTFLRCHADAGPGGSAVTIVSRVCTRRTISAGI